MDEEICNVNWLPPISYSGPIHALRRSFRGKGGFLSFAWCTETFDPLDHPRGLRN